MEPEDVLIFTVDELIAHLTNMKENGIINGTETVLDTAYFGITHVGVHDDAVTPFITLESEEINLAERTLDEALENLVKSD